MTGPSKPPRTSPRRSWFRKYRIAYLRQFPRRKHMHGGFLHRVLGEGLFDKRLWKPDRHRFAGGMAIGLFVGLLPTYWVQIIVAVFIAYLVRVNVTASVLGTLITNPFTTLPILGLQYKIGVWLIGAPATREAEEYPGWAKDVLTAVFSHGKPYLVGSLVTAVIAAILGYIAVLVFWQAGTKVKEVREKHREHQEHEEHNPD